MTVASTTNKVSYSGSAVRVLPYNFRIFEDSDLQVWKVTADGASTLLTLNIDYTVSGAGETSGGNVTLATDPLTTDTIVIKRELPYTQGLDYQPLDAFPAESHEEGLDRGVMLAQQIKEELGRAIKAPVTAPEGADYTLPNPSPNAMICWDSAGTGLENQDVGDLSGAIASAQAAQAAAELAEANAEAAETNAVAAETGAEAAEASVETWGAYIQAQIAVVNGLVNVTQYYDPWLAFRMAPNADASSLVFPADLGGVTYSEPFETEQVAANRYDLARGSANIDLGGLV
jgi:hypothetical protein